MRAGAPRLGTRWGAERDGAFGAGWYDFEVDGIRCFRWAGGPARIRVEADRPWQRVDIAYRFEDAVRHGAHVGVAGRPVSGAGVLHWEGGGWREGTVTLPEPVEAGTAELVLEPLQTSREPGGTRRLGVAVSWVALA